MKNGSIVRPNLTSTGGGQEAYTILPQSFATGNLVGSRKYSAVVVNHGFGANRQIPILFVFSMGAKQLNLDSSLELTEHLQVDRSSIADHLLTSNVIEVGPNENYHAPTLKQTLIYELRGAMLVAADNTASGSLSQNGISVRFPANWSVNRQDANSFSLISDGYKKKLADEPDKSYTEAPTADIDVLVVKSTTDTTLMQSAVAGGLTSNIAIITVNGHAAVAGMRDRFLSSYVIYVQNGINLYVIDFALREMATQLSAEERTILDSVTFQ